MRFVLSILVGTEVAPLFHDAFVKISYKNRKKKPYISFFIYICGPLKESIALKH